MQHKGILKLKSYSLDGYELVPSTNDSENPKNEYVQISGDKIVAQEILSTQCFTM